MTGEDYWRAACTLIDETLERAREMGVSGRDRGRLRARLRRRASEIASKSLDEQTLREFEAAREAWAWRV